jgi:hypothetical protein
MAVWVDDRNVSRRPAAACVDEIVKRIDGSEKKEEWKLKKYVEERRDQEDLHE